VDGTPVLELPSRKRPLNLAPLPTVTRREEETIHATQGLEALRRATTGLSRGHPEGSDLTPSESAMRGRRSCTQTYGGTNDPNGAGMSDERITSTSQTVLSNHLRRDHATDRSPRLISRVHRSMSAHAANASVHRAV
jgi:hypothetical protein